MREWCRVSVGWVYPTHATPSIYNNNGQTKMHGSTKAVSATSTAKKKNMDNMDKPVI